MKSIGTLRQCLDLNSLARVSFPEPGDLKYLYAAETSLSVPCLGNSPTFATINISFKGWIVYNIPCVTSLRGLEQYKHRERTLTMKSVASQKERCVWTNRTSRSYHHCCRSSSKICNSPVFGRRVTKQTLGREVAQPIDDMEERDLAHSCLLLHQAMTFQDYEDLQQGYEAPTW
jgi:hypothetical protein